MILVPATQYTKTDRKIAVRAYIAALRAQTPGAAITVSKKYRISPVTLSRWVRAIHGKMWQQKLKIQIKR